MKIRRKREEEFVERVPDKYLNVASSSLLLLLVNIESLLEGSSVLADSSKVR